MPESCDPSRVVPSRVVTGEPLTVTVSEVSPGTTLCRVTGDVDLLTGPTLREKLINAIESTPSHLVVDLSGVPFLASVGLGILVEILAAQEAASRQLAVVVENNSAVMQALETTGLDQVFDLHVTLTTAVAACSGSTSSPLPGAP